jgi:ferredoxin
MAHTVSSECVACGACVDTCPVGAITMEDKAVVDAASCVDCGACEGVCPTGAGVNTCTASNALAGNGMSHRELLISVLNL